MKFTKSMDAAYWKAFDLSKAAHAEHSNRPPADAADSTIAAKLKAPGDLLEAYTDEDDQAAFYAGWLDGARGSSTSRRRMEGSSQPH